MLAFMGGCECSRHARVHRAPTHGVRPPSHTRATRRRGLNEVTPPCQSPPVGRDTRESASELRAVAALVVTGPGAPQLVGACTLVTNGKQTVAFSSAELLRLAGEPLAIALTFDATKTIPVTAWTMSRSPQMGIIELGATFPADANALDVAPLPISAVSATVETRGAPSAIIGVHGGDGAVVWSRRVVPVHVDAVDGGGMSDDIITRLASPDQTLDIDAEVEGAALFSWMPADPVLGRPPETVLVALATKYVHRTFKPRELPALAELSGLEDLGRALPYRAPEKSATNDLGQIAGEIKAPEPPDPLAGLDVDIEGD
jgi:hypothetical protein